MRQKSGLEKQPAEDAMTFDARLVDIFQSEEIQPRTRSYLEAAASGLIYPSRTSRSTCSRARIFGSPNPPPPEVSRRTTSPFLSIAFVILEGSASDLPSRIR